MSDKVNPLLQGLLDSMQDLEDASANAKVLIYGESGVGKTVAAVQVAQAILKQKRKKNPKAKILYIDAVEGWVSLLNHPGLTTNVTRFVYQNHAQLMTLAQAFQADVEQVKDFEVIIFDELSTMSKKDLDAVLFARSAADKSKDPDVPTQPDFFANTERMRRLIVMFLGLQNKSIIPVSHLRNDKDDKAGYSIIRPGFMPKFSETLRENLHVVAHMTANEKPSEDGKILYLRQFQVHPTRLVVAKSRVGGLPTHVTVPEFITGLTEWMQGSRPDQDESAIEILDDSAVQVEETDDAFIGIEVE